ncbi:MAG: hypothetical protein Q8O53_01930 [Candidatus Moranbacteria bacterium]|nr:hypothetical protein [Candidatus Moranbacteria bacterium]
MSLRAVNKFFFLESSWRRSFVVTLVFVMLASLLFWLDTFRIYQSAVQILVVNKSREAATEQVVENFAELSRNLSFYERVLASSDLIDDDFEGYTKDRRKAMWNETVMVKLRAGSGILVVTAKQDTAEKAKRLSLQTAQTLFAVAGLYYDIQNDIDMRIVDEPIVKPVLGRPIPYVLTSLGSALVATVLFFLTLSLVPSFFGKRRSQKIPPFKQIPEMGQQVPPAKAQQDFVIGAAVPFIDPRKFLPTRPKALSYESSSEEEVIRQEILAPATKAAPDNLPGIDASELPFQFETLMTDLPMQEPSETIEITSPVTPLPDKQVAHDEPSIEEYKRRLNELLAGGK